MIVYVFNNYIHDESGFCKRCRKEINALSQQFDIMVICRGNGVKKEEVYTTLHKKIKILYYNPYFKNNGSLTNYKASGVYEIVRTIDLFVGLSSVLLKTLWTNRKEKIKIFSVVSPLTVPLIALLVGKLFNATPSVVSMHDLEPELAMHSKGLQNNSPILRIEYWLEKLVTQVYKHIIVTSMGQAKKLAERTNVSLHKISVFPNIINKTNTSVSNLSIAGIEKKYHLGSEDFVIGYISSFTFGYTINGMLAFLHTLPSLRESIPQVKVLIVGGGVGLVRFKELVAQLHLEDIVIFTGVISNVTEVLERIDVCIIPWEKDEMTEVILPTKLFEYMQAKKPIVAPNFGEFRTNLKNGHNAFLYNTMDELKKSLITLYSNKKLREEMGQKGYLLYKEKSDDNRYINQLINLL